MNHQRRRLTIGGADSSRRITDDPLPLPSLRMGLGLAFGHSMSKRIIAEAGVVE